jgi:organic radical activating enzyme
MNLTYKDPQKENWFLISWNLSSKCNYRCSYCPDELHNGATGWPEWNVVEKFVNNLDLPGKEVCFRISGGEPTYWKHFIDLAKLIKSKGHAFSFLTNASQTAEYFKKISPYTDGVILSFHPEYADLNHFVNIAEVLDCPVSVNLMLIKERFDEIYDIASYLYNNTKNLSVWPKVILDKTDNPDHITNEVSLYTEEQLQKIREWKFFRSIDDSKLHRGSILLNRQEVTANDLILQGKNVFRDWECWGGLHMLSIDKWGDVYRADCTVGGKLGNISNYFLPSEPVKCTFDKCSCLSDIYLKKIIPIQILN